jgi:heat shock protein HslJ/membrane-bound inhibitor of C-type lysozyme
VTRLVGAILLLSAFNALVQAPPESTAPDLAGTSWRLVRFQGRDHGILTPDDPAKYTIEFHPDGDLTMRIDCNRGRSTWNSSEPSQLQFGSLALTRATCPPGSLHDRIVRDWNFVRLYAIKDGRLFLSLMADGGIYEFEPTTATTSPPASAAVASTGPITYDCSPTGGETEMLSATFYQTRSAMVLVERAGRTRPAFRVPAASGARYQGQDLVFWDAHGEGSVIWSGLALACRRR